jgi:ATP-binding cassette subfamily B protein
LLAASGLYASMWNRQREAQEAREKLAMIGEEATAPNRDPPPIAAQPGEEPDAGDPLMTPDAAE